MDFDDLFDECQAQPEHNIETPKSFNFAEKIISEVEAEYTGKNTEIIDRKKEVLKLQKEIEADKNAISRIKMPKGAGTAKMRQMLAKQASDKRNLLRNRISRAECRLGEIDIETDGQLTKEKEAAAKRLEEIKKESKDSSKKEIAEKFGAGAWSSMNPYDDL